MSDTFNLDNVVWTPPVEECIFTEWKPTLDLRWKRLIGGKTLEQRFQRFAMFNGLVWEEFNEEEWRELPVVSDDRHS